MENKSRSKSDDHWRQQILDLITLLTSIISINYITIFYIIFAVATKSLVLDSYILY